MKDAVQFKFLSAPLNEGQLKELVQIVPGSSLWARSPRRELDGRPLPIWGEGGG
jgi:hypothetical protein